uniref:Uncharacterized protein n=1 Tax=Meloidogyne javanica TaxID=6303 RepID=A0A915MND3_MELJA
MSLPSNSIEQNDVEQDLNACSKDGNEAQSTILTDDISQELDCSEESDEGDRKTMATVNSSLAKNWIRTPMEVLYNLSAEEKLEIFKNNFFNNEYNNEWERADFIIKIQDRLAMEHMKKQSFSRNYKEIDIKVKSYDFSLNDDLKKKVRVRF